MRKYYIHNGTEQLGPFGFEELRLKGVNRNTPVWYEGLEKWTVIGNVRELESLISPTPPPIERNEYISSSVPPVVNSQPKPRKSGLGARLYWFTLLTLVVIFIILFVRDQQRVYSGLPPEGPKAITYEEKVLTVEETEMSQPKRFLVADGTYNRNFWGTKVKLQGKITSKATVAKFKDPVVQVTFFSKTKTILKSEEYTIYELIAPGKTINFMLKLEISKEVETVGWEVIDAQLVK